MHDKILKTIFTLNLLSLQVNNKIYIIKYNKI